MEDGIEPKSETHAPGAQAQQGFYLMAKPSGPSCNLSCTYCFYREKKGFFPEYTLFRMSDEVLEAYIREYITAQPGPSVTFDWQGGEPTLMGMDFFQRALDLQKRYGDGRHIQNALQTNGTLLDDGWCDFLSENGFLVGLSMDGPDSVHDLCRVDRDGRPTFAKVLNGLKLLQRHGVEVNILATVNRETSQHPLEVYCFFRDQGVQFIQFIPVIERRPDTAAEKPGLTPADPPDPGREERPAQEVTPWSVDPEQYGEFLIQIFDEWKTRDVGRVFVMNFEWALGAWAGAGPGMCYFTPRCGRNLIIEHNGDIFSCDHFMYPDYRLGNILDGGLVKMVESSRQTAFGASKETTLPGYCRDCDLLFVCHGGCPKHRFIKTPEGEPGLNYLCAGYKGFYHSVAPAMNHMAELILRGLSVEDIMDDPGD